jgi:hypothetical protein
MHPRRGGFADIQRSPLHFVARESDQLLGKSALEIDNTFQT